MAATWRLNYTPLLKYVRCYLIISLHLIEGMALGMTPHLVSHLIVYAQILLRQMVRN